MTKSKKKLIFVLLCIVVLLFTGYQIFNKKNNNSVSSEVILSNAKNEKVSMPYINPEWTEYMKLDEEERANIKEPQIYIYNYIPDEDADYSNLPNKYNLRDEYPTVLYDQGAEGLCWAYATVEMLESNLKVTKGIDIQFSVDQLDLLTRSEKYYKNKYNPYSLNRYGSEGLYFGNSYEYENLILSSGVVPVEKNKFTIDKYDTNVDYYNIWDVANTNNVDYTIANTVNFPVYEDTKEYRDMMKNYIKNYGAILISTTADFKNQIIDYHGGRFDKLLGHDMVIIGWDDDYAGGAWILQNSWNEAEYEQYYIKYSSFIFELYGVKEIINKEWDNCYNISNFPNSEYKGISLHQDPTITPFVGNDVNDIKESNAIAGSVIVSYSKPAIRKEKLKMINFISASQNSTYKVYVSDNGNKDNFVYIKDIETDMPGLYTVYFDNIYLNNNEFSIMIESENGAMYQTINAFSTTISVDEPEKDIYSYVDSGSFNVDGNYEYHIVSNTVNVNDGERIEYSIYDKQDHRFSQALQFKRETVNNGQSICKIELPRNTKLHTKLYVDVEYNYEVVENLEIEYIPKTNFGDIDGSGTEEDPYIITNESQLSLISMSPSAYYVLGNDIDLTYNSEDDVTFNRGVGWKPLDKFCGTLDGQGHSIRNMHIYSRVADRATEYKYVGLFSIIDGATIKNLNIVDATIINMDTKYYNIGCLAGKAIDSNVYNVMISGSINCMNSNCNFTNVGLLIGSMVDNNSNINLNKISCIGNIISGITDNVGGVIGESETKIQGSNLLVFTEISNQFNNSSVGGILGKGEITTLDDSFIFPKMKVEDESRADIIYAESNKYNIERIKNVATFDSTTHSDSINNYQAKDGDNIILVKHIYDINNTTIDRLGFDASIWEYLPDNPYPTLKGQQYLFDKEDVNPVNSYKIHTYDCIEDKKIIDNILPTTIEHYKENLALENPYTAKVFKIKNEDGVEVEEEVTEGNIGTGMITRIYFNDEFVTEYVNVVPGDLDGDGIIRSRDCSVVKQYLIGLRDNMYGTPQYYAADFTRDGKVRLNDAERIQQYVVKMFELNEEDYYGENN